MADLLINDEDAALLREIARRENRPVEEIVSRMIAAYAQSTKESIGDYAKRVKAAEREILPKIYAKARAYWRSAGDTDRLTLTDEQLDEQFWCIDPDGIPRLISEQNSVQLPPDPLLRMAEMALQSGERSIHSDISERFDEAMEEAIRDEMRRREVDQRGE